MSKAGETATFTYNADGLRVKKVCTTTGTTDYTLHGKNVVHLSNGSNNLHFFYDAQNRPAVVVFNGTAYGYVHNLQGDIVAIVNSAGDKVVEYAYDAWGKPIGKIGSLASTLGTLSPFRYRGYVYDDETDFYYLRKRYYRPLYHRFISADQLITSLPNQFSYTYDAWGNPISKSGSMAGTLGTLNPFRYRGYIYDEESKLYYLHNRYYDSKRERFLNSDPILGHTGVLYSHNLYAYCANSPVIHYDPTGCTSLVFRKNDFYAVCDQSGAGGAAGVAALTAEQLFIAYSDNLRNGVVALCDQLKSWLNSLAAPSLETAISEAMEACPEYAALVTALNKAKEKGMLSTKEPSKEYNRHHVIAQHASSAEPARTKWLKFFSINDASNMVSVSTQMHWFMHQEAYYQSVNKLVEAAVSIEIGSEKDRIQFAVKKIGQLIRLIDNQ